MDVRDSPEARADARRRRTTWTAVLVVALVVLAASLAALGTIGASYLQGQQKYARVAEHVEIPESAAEGQEGDFGGIVVDWDALLALNPDTVGWVYIPNTRVNYPVVQGSDNEYYLTHDFGGEEGWLASYGAVFLDWRNDPSWTDEANFVYGHHMNDGSMFADIASMADPARFDECRTAYLLTPRGDFRLRSFSLLHCAADDPIVQIGFEDDAQREAYVQDKIDRSVVPVGDVPAADRMGRIFAFATCDDFSSGRYVLFTYVEGSTAGGPGL